MTDNFVLAQSYDVSSGDLKLLMLTQQNIPESEKLSLHIMTDRNKNSYTKVSSQMQNQY
jgi:hypothetical protein